MIILWIFSISLPFSFSSTFISWPDIVRTYQFLYHLSVFCINSIQNFFLLILENWNIHNSIVSFQKINYSCLCTVQCIYSLQCLLQKWEKKITQICITICSMSTSGMGQVFLLLLSLLQIQNVFLTFTVLQELPKLYSLLYECCLFTNIA